MTSSSHQDLLPPSHAGTVTLADGRTLGYGLYGATGGPVVFVLDGPGSRGLARATANAATDLGLALLAPDRPGFGHSSPSAPIDYNAVANDLLELADTLEIRRFGILGQSGGTPYSLALAAAAGDRCTGLAFIGGISPLGEPDALQDVSGPMRTVFRLSRAAPWLLRPLFGMVARQTTRDPEAAAKKYAEDLPAADLRVLAEPGMWAIHAVSSAEAVESPGAFVAEARRLSKPWHIDLVGVRAPVAFWVGEEDPTHPQVMSRRMSARLGDAPVTVVPGAATFGMLPVYGDALAHAAALPVAA